MTKIIYKEITKGIYNVLVESGNNIGRLICLEDGFFYFDPGETKGVWQAWVMTDIANKLNELNEPWMKQLTDAYQKSNQKEINLDPFSPDENEQ